MVGTAAVLAFIAAPAFAQEAPAQPAAEPAVNSGDIVVTATRQSTMLSKTPIAMTAISAEGLRNSGVQDARSLAAVVPNLAITENGDAVRISIRGVTSTDGTEKGDPSAAFLMDGIYIARPADQQGSFFDVERVEVLRGPQGTLYGRNTTAGLVNIITARPKDKFEGSFDAKYGNYDAVNLTGMLNYGFGNGLGLRFAANYDRMDSTITQPSGAIYATGAYRNVFSSRLSFGGDLGKLKFVIRADYSQQKGSLLNQVTLANFYSNINTIGVDPTFLNRSAADYAALGYKLANPSAKNNKNYGIMGEFSYPLTDRVDVTYVGSYRKTDRADVRELLLFGVLQNPAVFNGKFKQVSQEVRVAFGRGLPLHGQVGAYYFNEETTLEYNLGNPLASLISANAIGYSFPQGPVKATSKAAFAQLTYDVTSELHLTGGIRFTHDDKSRDGKTVLYFPTAASSYCGATTCVLNLNVAARSFEKVTWKVGLDYDVPGLGLAYASVSTGYKAGGFNDGCITGQGTGCGLNESQLYYAPETLTAYEAGIKFKLLNGKVRFNASLFHYDYSNMQLSQAITVNNAPQLLIQNAGTAKVDGVETDVSFSPWAGGQFNASLNYTNARYSSFFPALASGQSRNFAGMPLDQAPKWTSTLGYTHTLPLANGASIEAGVATKLSSAYYMQDLSYLLLFRQPGYTKTDLNVSYKANGNRWYVQGFVKNIENAITVASASSGIAATVTFQEPRTYGIRTGYKF
ncbi:TonB-dependent receptor [Novosphingobium sp. FSY-8]|uniref:TonB-dependent receptor n=2 Tax=Novosphingobium ovatum TaxID=1908523 RepID=A0ABW9XEI5_9SPHN|nr:TonB-dependent receptor [Novosphingobium ovatum]